MNINQRVAKIAECFARNPKSVLFVALLATVLALWATLQLPVHTSRQALLPQNTEVARRFNAFLQNFGAASDLIVVLEGAPRSELEAFADELSSQLASEAEIGLATSHLDITFFLKHAYLMMPEAGLAQLAGLTQSSVPATGDLESYLQQALLKSQQPAGLGGDDVNLQAVESGLKIGQRLLQEWLRWLSVEAVPPQLDWGELAADSGIAGVTNGYFASRDGRMVFLFVHPHTASSDFEHLGPFVEKVKAVAKAATEQRQAAGRVAPQVGLTGLPAIEYEEFVNIRQDIKLVILTSAGLIAALILLVVRSLRWAVLIFVPMGLGVLWSLGLALVTVGHLTIITAAFIAILFGLGADYGIFTSSRIAEERRAGRPLVEAIGVGIGSSFGAVLTAGGASLLIFSALATVDFPGFSELGVVAAKGVLMILISTWMVQPALYALLPPRLAERPAPEALPKRGFAEKFSGRFPGSVALLLVAVAVGGAVLGGIKGLAIPFDYDVLAMLPKASQAAHYQRRMVAESDYQAEVIIFTAKNLEDARRIQREAAKLPSIAQVQSLIELFPADAESRVARAKAIGEAFAHAGYAQQVATLERAGLSSDSFALLKTLLTNSIALIDDAEEQAFSAGHGKIVASLETIRGQLTSISAKLAADGEQGRARTELFLRALLSGAASGLAIIDTWQAAEALSPAQLPPALHDRFFSADGSMALYAFPAKSVYDPDNLDVLIKEVYGVSPEATGFPTTHQAFAKSVVQSFSKGTQWALVLCLLWILLATRSLRGFVLAALPLLMGGGWMLGLMALGGIHYNYSNIVALPLVIALAVDYGVWFSYRWRELRPLPPLLVSLDAGKVIALAAGTELAGLGAITLASYRGVSSLGITITIGLVCCLIATLLVAPAIGQLLDFRRKS